MEEENVTNLAPHDEVDVIILMPNSSGVKEDKVMIWL